MERLQVVVNDITQTIEMADHRRSLLDLVREDLDLHGTKKGRGVYRRVPSDPGLIPALFEEILRPEPAAQMFDNRHALADIPVGDTIIPEGGRIVLVTAPADRDPTPARRFADLDTFDFDRPDNQHLSFQGGPTTASARRRPASSPAP